jgi:hypothetical protein
MAATKVRAQLIELYNMNQEVNRIKISLKQLQDKCNLIKTEIQKYLIDTHQTSIIYQDMKIENSVKQKRQRKPKVKKDKDAIDVLQKAGIRDARRLYSELVESMKGEVKEQNVIKIDNTKK